MKKFMVLALCFVMIGCLPENIVSEVAILPEEITFTQDINFTDKSVDVKNEVVKKIILQEGEQWIDDVWKDAWSVEFTLVGSFDAEEIRNFNWKAMNSRHTQGLSKIAEIHPNGIRISANRVGGLFSNSGKIKVTAYLDADEYGDLKTDLDGVRSSIMATHNIGVGENIHPQVYWIYE